MSPTSVTFTSPVLPTAYTWEATNEQVAERYGVPIRSRSSASTSTPPPPRRPSSIGCWPRASSIRPLSEYPPSDYRRLTEAAAARYGVGTDELLSGRRSRRSPRLVAKAFLAEGSRAVLPAPTVRDVPGADFEQRGAGIVAVPRRPAAEGWALDIDAVRAAARGSKVVWLCSPNNPTGLAEPDGTIEALLAGLAADAMGRTADRRARRGVRRVRRDDPLPLRDAYPRLIVVRTASKAYALAGLRVGFAIAGAEVIARMNPYRPPGSVSTVSVTIVTEALLDRRSSRATSAVSRPSAAAWRAG